MSHREKSKPGAPALSGRQHSSWSEKFMGQERWVPASTQRGIYLTLLALAAVGWGLFLVLLVGVLSQSGLQRYDQHPRPPVGLMLFGADSTYSFPSWHVLGTSSFLLILAFLIATRRQQTSLTVLLFAIAAVVILAQVASRWYLGYHWLSDTAASITLSLLILGVLMSIDTARTIRVPCAHSQPQVHGT